MSFTSVTLCDGNLGVIYRSPFQARIGRGRVQRRTSRRPAVSRRATARRWTQPTSVSARKAWRGGRARIASDKKRQAGANRRRRQRMAAERTLIRTRIPAGRLEREARSRMDFYKAKKVAQDTRKRFSQENRVLPGGQEYRRRMRMLFQAGIYKNDTTALPGYSDWKAGRISMKNLMENVSADYDRFVQEHETRKAGTRALEDLEDQLYDQRRAAEQKAKMRQQNEARMAISRRRHSREQRAKADIQMRAAQAASGTFAPGEYPAASRSGVNPNIAEATTIFTDNRNLTPQVLTPTDYNSLVRGIEQRAKKTARTKMFYYVYAGKRRSFPVTRRSVIQHLQQKGFSKAQKLPTTDVVTVPSDSDELPWITVRPPPGFTQAQAPPTLASRGRLPPIARYVAAPVIPGRGEMPPFLSFPTG